MIHDRLSNIKARHSFELLQKQNFICVTQRRNLQSSKLKTAVYFRHPWFCWYDTSRETCCVSFHINQPFSAWYQPRARKLVSVYIYLHLSIHLSTVTHVRCTSASTYVYVFYTIWGPRIIGRAVDQWYKQDWKCKHDKTESAHDFANNILL